MQLKMLSKRDNLEYEFLPAALEIAETPPSPLGSFIIWSILIIIAVALAWSYFGMVDEVAVARGKIIPDGRLKVIQPFEEGVVTAIHVEEGQRVKDGELLLELDSTIKNIDVKSLENALATTKYERDMLNAELEGKDTKDIIEKWNLSTFELPEDVKQLIELQKKARESDYESKSDTLLNAIKQRESELKGAETTLLRLESKYKLLVIQEDSMRKLNNSGSIPKMDLMLKQDELIATEKEYETQKISIQQCKEKIEEANLNLTSLKKQMETDILNQLVEKEKNIANIEAQLQKAKKIFGFQNLISPVNGVIHGLNSNTIGGVVTPAQALISIVPDGTPLIVEAIVLNKDIGFVKMGQETEVKFDTFPFQKYGTVLGNVISISPDAFEDEKMGLVYRMKVRLEKETITIDGKDVNISPGMTVSAEIKTGKKRIIEFFLEPIIKYTKESISLR